jgi:hypothetical protein
MMLAALALAFVVALLAGIEEDFAILGLVPFLCFVAGFVRVLYNVFLAEKRALRVKGAAPQPRPVPLAPGQPGAAARGRELPPPLRAAPVGGYSPQRAGTAEMVRPPSVTENTTRLLDEEGDARRG